MSLSKYYIIECVLFHTEVWHIAMGYSSCTIFLPPLLIQSITIFFARSSVLTTNKVYLIFLEQVLSTVNNHLT